jgi:hypothetical protein
MGPLAKCGSPVGLRGELRSRSPGRADSKPPARLAADAFEKGGTFMHGKTARASVCVMLALLGLVVAGCGKGYRQIVVIDGGTAEFVTYGPPPKEVQQVWVPGRILVFRTDSPVPGVPNGPSGKAGHAYRVTDDNQLEEVGEFELTIPNDTLAYRYGK